MRAIPAFARKYSMSCTTCHAPFPAFKPYGDEFAGNGFVLKDKDAPRYTVETGDDNLALIRDFRSRSVSKGTSSYSRIPARTSTLPPPNLKLFPAER